MRKTVSLLTVFLAFFSIVVNESTAQRANDLGGQDNRSQSSMQDTDQEKLAWYGTLDSALAEAKRTERPIFLVAARPECRGVPGKW